MPFCTQCGNQVTSAAAYCPACGKQQPGAGTPKSDLLADVSPVTASTFCYTPFVGWIAALIVLSSQRFRNNDAVRFHAFQGLYLALFWLLIDVALLPIFGIGGAIVRRAVSGSLRLATLAGMCFLMYKTSREEEVRIPFLADLAGRSAAEQGFRA